MPKKSWFRRYEFMVLPHRETIFVSLTVRVARRVTLYVKNSRDMGMLHYYLATEKERRKIEYHSKGGSGRAQLLRLTSNPISTCRVVHERALATAFPTRETRPIDLLHTHLSATRAGCHQLAHQLASFLAFMTIITRRRCGGTFVC
jgi:hypothetical protein